MTTTPTAGDASAHTLAAGERTIEGNIAARIDRLPLLATHYRYAAITQIFWGVLVAADALVASLYPFLYAPKHLISTFQFDVLLGTNIGAGILIGEYVGGFLSDAIGRKKTLIASALVQGLTIWPIAFTTKFYWLWLWNGLFSLGIGMMLSSNAAYIHEIAPPGERQKLSLRTQAIAPVGVALVGGVTGYYWVPGHYKWWLYILSAAPIVILVPLGMLGLPESPRWLEAKGRVAEADRTVSKWEQAAEAKYGPLAPLAVGRHTVVQTEKVPVGEVFKGQYSKRTWVLFAVWFFGYSGLVYGFASFFPTFAVIHAHWNAHQVFLWTRILPLPALVITFWIMAAFGEKYERKAWQLFGAIGFGILVLLLLVLKGTTFLEIVAIASVPFIYIWLFTMYNYTSAAYPTRLRSVGTGWTDGVGHLGAIVGTSLLVGRLFSWTLSSGGYGWLLYCAIPGAVLPAVLLWWVGMKQKGGILEELSQ